MVLSSSEQKIRLEMSADVTTSQRTVATPWLEGDHLIRGKKSGSNIRLHGTVYEYDQRNERQQTDKCDCRKIQESLGCVWHIKLCGEEAAEKPFLEERRCTSKWFWSR
ncbi:hypothetical protein C1X05_00650 [Laceyella sacchari]|nr:hypothetical protein C1X05_00650 [Laceyella sacchari]